MELKYLLCRYRGKRILFVLHAREEEIVRHRLENSACKIYFTGIWQESLEKFELRFAKVERWIVTSEWVVSDVLTSLICDAHVKGKKVEDIESFFLELQPMVPASASEVVHFLTTQGVHKDFLVKAYIGARHFLEPLVALALMILISPIFLMVALAVKVTSPGPVFYTQERVGYKGKIFNIFKFRSMRVDAEGGVAAWASASKTDSRLTSIGGFLRSAHLDELPQLLNIVRGEVSFIGPRPERPEFVRELTARYPLFKLRPLVKPGVTGWAQVQQGYANSFGDSLHKLELDLFYIIKFSPILDFTIAVKTIAIIFLGGTEGLKRARDGKMLVSASVKQVQ